MNERRVVRCQRCGTPIQGEGAYVWQVMKVLGDGQEVFLPTCSEECAQAVIKDAVTVYRRRMQAMKNQSPQIIPVQDWM